MQKLAWLLSAILILSLAISCAPPKPPVPAGEAPPAPTLPAATEVTTIDVEWGTGPENWDADPETDGIKVCLVPKNADDKMVTTPGMVSAKLWLRLMEGEKGDLIQEWSGIQITKDDYDWILGATIRLEYKGFQPKKMQIGILEVTLITPDGKSFTARNSYVPLEE